MRQPSLLDTLKRHRVVLCAGCGGVGKTTVTAALGLGAARAGLRVLTLTVDPARRLAESLGLDSVTTQPQQVPAETLRQAGVTSGRLTVMLLDPKQTFDELVTRYASTEQARDRILTNRLYQYLSTQLAGTREYMAMEKLLGVSEDPAYDVIILDTPPTRHALDFLTAPARMIEALDSGAVRWFSAALDESRRVSFRLVSKGVARILRSMSKVMSYDFLEQFAGLVGALNDLFGGFRERALRVAETFKSPDFAYVIVTSTAAHAIAEAGMLSQHLAAEGVEPRAYVVNRVLPRYEQVPSAADVRAALGRRGIALRASSTEVLRGLAQQEAERAERDAAACQQLRGLAGGGFQLRVPMMVGDVHSIQALGAVTEALCPELAVSQA